MDLHFLSEATAEAEEARRWYARRDLELASDFDQALANAVTQIKKSPTTWPQYMHGTQRYLVWRFPFAIVYVVESEVIYVVAIAHYSRRPGYWGQRRP